MALRLSFLCLEPCDSCGSSAPASIIVFMREVVRVSCPYDGLPRGGRNLIVGKCAERKKEKGRFSACQGTAY